MHFWENDMSKEELLSALERERSVWCDKPEDRLYHHEDQTWWKRDKNNNCVRADEPDYVKELRDELRKANESHVCRCSGVPR